MRLPEKLSIVINLALLSLSLSLSASALADDASTAKIKQQPALQSLSEADNADAPQEKSSDSVPDTLSVVDKEPTILTEPLNTVVTPLPDSIPTPNQSPAVDVSIEAHNTQDGSVEESPTDKAEEAKHESTTAPAHNPTAENINLEEVVDVPSAALLPKADTPKAPQENSSESAPDTLSIDDQKSQTITEPSNTVVTPLPDSTPTPTPTPTPTATANQSSAVDVTIETYNTHENTAKEAPTDKTEESEQESTTALAHNPTAENINLQEVVDVPSAALIPTIPDDSTPETQPVAEVIPSIQASGKKLNHTRNLLGVDISPGTTTRVNWSPSRSFAGIAADTPVLVVNGTFDGPTLCLTAAIHGDELNGIEVVRRVLYNLNPEQLHGMVVGVPIVNLLGFSRNSRYLPDRRDLNRYFPGNSTGSAASRLAHTFFNDVVAHCDALIDLHTGSFYRTNITQLRANLNVPAVAEFTALFGDIPVLNTAGDNNSLRAAAVRVGIPAVTIEAGEPMRMQSKVVEEAVTVINTLLDKNGMYPSLLQWANPSPAFYRSVWLRANTAGILFSKVKLGANVKKGDVLGQVINPISNEKNPLVSQYQGKVLGMALDQFVLPGFATYHIGIREQDAKKLIKHSQEMPDTDKTNTLAPNNEKPTPTEPNTVAPNNEEPSEQSSDSLKSQAKPEMNPRTPNAEENAEEGFDE